MLTIEQVYSITELGASLDSRRTFFFCGAVMFFFLFLPALRVCWHRNHTPLYILFYDSC
jgi:hypothetical protein